MERASVLLTLDTTILSHEKLKKACSRIDGLLDFLTSSYSYVENFALPAAPPRSCAKLCRCLITRVAEQTGGPPTVRTLQSKIPQHSSPGPIPQDSYKSLHTDDAGVDRNEGRGVVGADCGGSVWGMPGIEQQKSPTLS